MKHPPRDGNKVFSGTKADYIYYFNGFLYQPWHLGLVSTILQKKNVGLNALLRVVGEIGGKAIWVQFGLKVLCIVFPLIIEMALHLEKKRNT